MTHRPLVYAVAAWSGFHVMAIELLAGRILAPTFGSSIHVWGGVIAVFMLALSAGYLAGGQFSLHAPRLRRLGALLVAVGATTLPVVAGGGPLLEGLFDRVHDPRWGSIAASTLLFFVPAALCGAISPYAVRLLVQRVEGSGRSAGLLYFCSTAGSAAGTLATSFWLVALFEVNRIVLTLAAVSMTLGACAILAPQARDEASAAA